MSKRRTKKQKIKAQVRRQQPSTEQIKTKEKIIKITNKNIKTDIKADLKTSLIIKDLRKTGWVCLLLLLGLGLIYWQLN